METLTFGDPFHDDLLIGLGLLGTLMCFARYRHSEERALHLRIEGVLCKSSTLGKMRGQIIRGLDHRTRYLQSRTLYSDATLADIYQRALERIGPTDRAWADAHDLLRPDQSLYRVDWDLSCWCLDKLERLGAEPTRSSQTKAVKLPFLGPADFSACSS